MIFRPIGELCARITSGGTPSRAKPEYFTAPPEGHRWVKSKELLDCAIADTEERISDQGLQKSSAKYLPEMTVLVAMYGANVGQLGWLRHPATVNQAICGLVADPQKAYYRYLYYALLATREGLISKAQGAAQQNLNQDAIKSFAIPAPDLPTQRRIASILSAYDELIENNTRRIAILEEMARRIYEEWFVRFRFPGHEQVKMTESELGLIPEGWRRGSINELYQGLYDGPHATPKPSTSGPVFLGIGNLTETGRMDLSSVRHIAEEDFGKWTKRVCPQPGDIVFTYEATLNRYALIPNGFRGCLGRRLALIRTNAETHSSLYLFCMFFSEGWRQIVAQNTLSGATVDRIPLSKFPSFPIMVPSMRIMAAFDEIVRPMFAEIEVLGRKNQNLRATRDLLLPKLISGELDVSTLPEPEEAIAA